MQIVGIPSSFNLEHHGLKNLKTVYWNAYPPALVEEIINRREGDLAQSGSVVVCTGQHTGRSPKDKYVVQYSGEQSQPIWWGKVNQPISPEHADRIYRKMLAYLQGRDVFVQDLYAGAYPTHQVPIRVITDKAWASLFAHNLFRRITPAQMVNHIPEFVILHCPDFLADPTEDSTLSSTFIIVDFGRGLILIGGTSYAGEIKKSIFTVLNYIYPLRGILSMHCSANVGARGDVALFFGLSGTGKTTLSSDLDRRLIGDDEHGWGDEGVFNFEGGCYAKTIHLRSDLEPLIWEASRRFGTVLENVVLDNATREADFENSRLTENTRAAYPIEFVPNHVVEGYSGHPENIFFLSADASGVLPPLALLSPEQAMYYFLSGYTSKIAGTEKGLGVDPEVTFSTCFGAPFLPLHPSVYADMLGEKIARHQARVWLVNTGWTGGPYGVGERIRLPYTRALVKAALNHSQEPLSFCLDEYFGVQVPCAVRDVPAEILSPSRTWKDAAAYGQKAQELSSRFAINFAQFESSVSTDIQAAGPHG